MTTQTPTQTSLLTAALDYAAAGWAVVPCRERPGPNEKAPYTRHGVNDASTAPDTIRRWWTRWPGALIGARVPDSVLVLDIDPRNGGSLDTLTTALGRLSDTLTALSGRGDGGRHLYYRRPPGPLARVSLPAGIDLKLNGYCIVPPSPHPATGVAYQWDGTDMATLPAAAVAALRPPRTTLPARQAYRAGDAAAEHLVRFLRRFPDHGINNALFWAACRAAEDGILDQALTDRLVTTAVELGSPERAARGTVQSAARTGGAR